jgi:putative isomerase
LHHKIEEAMKLAAISLSGFLALAISVFPLAAQQNSTTYEQLQRDMARGWNTWNTRSVTSHVLLPEGLSINVGIKHNAIYQETWLPELLIGRQGPDAERIVPGIHTSVPHAEDGRYTDLRVRWLGHEMRIQSATEQNDLVLLITPLKNDAALAPTVVFSVSMLWDRAGSLQKSKDRITSSLPADTVNVYLTGQDSADFGIPVAGAYFTTTLDGPVAVSTGKRRSLQEIQLIIDHTRTAAERHAGENTERAIQTVLNWDTIYEPEHGRVVTPVSRIFNIICGGYMLFDWDDFFAATLAATYDRDLAYANAMETLNSTTPAGFVPNFSRGKDWKSLDRSEPPVGSMTVLALFKQFHDRWFLVDAYPRLLRWNLWWPQHRDAQGYLVYGSGNYDTPWRQAEQTVNTLQAAKYESGLDNSPMYDGVEYDSQTHHMQLADVGLMSLYVADCDALSQIASELGKASEATSIHERGEHYRAALKTLWDEKTGAFLNKDLHTGKPSSRLSPNIFYPLLAHAATPEQAKRLVEEHLRNPDEFWGDWVIPSIARNDPAFKDQDYWRGRIWAPMNFLVYLGLRNYGFPDVRKQLAQKSLDLLMRDWRSTGHIHENYNGITGDGDDKPNSDRFYHWGALLGLISSMENENEKQVH